MDWRTLAPIVGGVAPVAGKILGSFIPIPGAGIAGELLGKAIATTLGVSPEPAVVNDALAKMKADERLATINAALEKCRAEIAGWADVEKATLAALQESVRQTNETMREETRQRAALLLAGKKEHWFWSGWRPAIGWAFAANVWGFGMLLMLAGIQAAWFDKPKPLQHLVDAWPLYAAFFGVLGLVVGIFIPVRTYEKLAAQEAVKPQVVPVKSPLPSMPAKPSLVKPVQPRT